MAGGFVLAMISNRHTALAAFVSMGISILAFIQLVINFNAQLVGNVTSVLAVIIGVFLCVSYCLVTFSAVIGKIWAIQAYLGILVFIMDAVLIARPEGMVGIDWYSLMKFVVALGALAIGVSHWRKTIELFSSIPLGGMLVYGGWAMGSAVYSVTPTYSFAAGIIFLSYVLFASAAAQLLSLKEILIGILVSLTVFYLLSLIAYFLLPNLGQTRAWSQAGFILRFCGLAGEPNNMARILGLMTVVVVVLYSVRYIGWKLAISLLGFYGLGIVMTMSRATVAAVLLSLTIQFMRWRTQIVMPFIFISIILYCMLSFASFSFDISKISRSGDVKEVTTFTGRTEIWAFCWNKIKERPLIGYGFAASRKVISQGYQSRFGFITKSAHNMWIQNLLSVGIIGTFPIVFVILVLIRDFFKTPNSFRDITLLIVLFSGLLEGGAIGSTPNLLTLFWLISISQVASSEKNKVRVGGMLKSS